MSEPQSGPKGRLFLIPVPLSSSGGADQLPLSTLGILRALVHFVVENPKTARKILKACSHPLPLTAIRMQVLDEHTPTDSIPALLTPIHGGFDLGLMSEAGCPAVADPGAHLVRLAHEQAITVIPMVGPSSILLALMASGLEGQRFAFRGYLPVEAGVRRNRILYLEKLSRQERETEVVIETPYRNAALFSALLEALQPDTRLSVALDLTGSGQMVRSATVANWRKSRTSLPERLPCVFLFLSQC